MNPIFKNILAIISGIVVGSFVNMGIIMLSGTIIPPPEGADVTTMEGLQKSMHLFQPKHFIMPFLAHALGTFVGAFIAAMIAATHKMKFAIGTGIFFLLGGIANSFVLPAPTWYIVTDVVLAYLPFAYAAGKLNTKNKSGDSSAIQR